MGEKLSLEDLENAREAASFIMEGFTWRKSKKGYKFWSAVHKELKRIAETGEP